MNDKITLQFDMHTRLFNNVLQDIEEEESYSRFNNSNNVKWLAGHLVSTRLLFANFSGISDDGNFKMFGKGFDSSLNYPTLENIKSKWNEIAEPISKGLKNLSQDELKGKGLFPTPIGDDNMKNFIEFVLHHEAYHLGQIGILRKQLGKESMKYG
jgi:uncharacterized damage-inducible protein DinB